MELEDLYQKERLLLTQMQATLQSSDGIDWRAQMRGAVEAYEALLLTIIKMNRVADRQHAWLIETQEKLKSTNEALEVVSSVDSLTGLWNRHKISGILDMELARFSRTSIPSSMILIDIDHFKSINDTFGHNRGDDVLVLFARTLERRIRATDYGARWGGDEFLVLLPQTAATNAVALAEALRCAVEETPFPGRKVTISLGVAELAPGMRLEDWVATADQNLYEAKNSGRNRTGFSTP